MKKTIDISGFLRNELITKGYSPRLTRETVQLYNSRVADRDKKEIYAKFSVETSPIRVVVATTALRIGIDIPNVDRVV